MNNPTQVIKDFKEKSVLVTRELNAPVEMVWRAFTEKELLDQWWGPDPWRAETKYLDFSVGGYWLYAMVGPEGERHWGKMNYISIEVHKNFFLQDIFCDEDGNQIPEMPVSDGSIVFTITEAGTKVEFKMIFPSEEHLQKIVEMGFEQGITICFEQLDKLVAKGV